MKPEFQQLTPDTWDGATRGGYEDDPVAPSYGPVDPFDPDWYDGAQYLTADEMMALRDDGRQPDD